MKDEKLVRLARLLYERTKDGDIRWEETALRDTFQCSFPSYSVLISQKSFSGLADPKPMRILKICNEEGKTIEEISDAAPPLSGRIELKELFELARRDAMGVEKALDEILDFLGSTESKR